MSPRVTYLFIHICFLAAACICAAVSEQNHPPRGLLSPAAARAPTMWFQRTSGPERLFGVEMLLMYGLGTAPCATAIHSVQIQDDSLRWDGQCFLALSGGGFGGQLPAYQLPQALSMQVLNTLF